MLKKILIVLVLTLLMVLMPLRVVQARTITVAVIDSGIDSSLSNLCKMGHKSFVTALPNPLADENGHGTHIAGIINSTVGAGNYCLVSIKYYNPNASGKENLANMVKAIQYAVNIKVKYINISGGGPEFNEEEYKAIENALKNKINLVVAAGNEHSDLDKSCNYFPACYDDRIVMVGNLMITKDFRNLDTDWKWMNIMTGVADKLGTYETDRSPSSNYGNRVTRWEIGTNVESTLPGGKTGRMTGTSQATAVATGKMVKLALHRR